MNENYVILLINTNNINNNNSEFLLPLLLNIKNLSIIHIKIIAIINHNGNIKNDDDNYCQFFFSFFKIPIR